MAKILNTTKPVQSRIDPSRKTVGAIYREAAEKNSDAFVINGDLTSELERSLVDDLNETIASNPFENQPFYITVYEKKDLQMKRAFLRRLYVSKYRPYPEDDTLVFHVEPNTNKVKFCWCLPHHTEMDNMLINCTLYNTDLINDILAWKAMNLGHFGFTFVPVFKKDLHLWKDSELKKRIINWFNANKRRKKIMWPVPTEENRDKVINSSELVVAFNS